MGRVRERKGRRRWSPAMLAGAWTAAAILVVGLAAVFGQAPGQSPSPPPFHIPHIGGSRQPRPQPELSTEGPVYVVLWFDTEDYILPQSDDAAKRIAVFLGGFRPLSRLSARKHARSSGADARNVISALAQHDIGYHANTHSQHPTVAEYESNLDWDEGVQEFSRRERPGFEDVSHIFRKTP